jgi:hypothetical protein
MSFLLGIGKYLREEIVGLRLGMERGKGTWCN